MRSSTTTIESSRTHLRTGIKPTATIRVQRSTDKIERPKPTNSTSNTSNAATSRTASQRRISQHTSTDVPPIPPRTRQTNGGGRINLSHSQGFHSNARTGIGSNTTPSVPQTRNNRRAPIQSLTTTPTQFSQTQPQSRRSNAINTSTNSSNVTSQAPRTQARPTQTPSSNNSTSHTSSLPRRSTNANRVTEDKPLFPRPLPAAEAARRRHQRSNNPTTTNSNAQSPNANHAQREENGTRVTNHSRNPPQARSTVSPRTNAPNSNRPSPPVTTSEPTIMTPTPHSEVRTTNIQQPPSANIGSTREPQVLIRSSANTTTNSTTTSNNTNPHLTRNQQTTTNISPNPHNNTSNTNITQQQTTQPSNTTQQRTTRPTFANIGTRATPNMNGNNPPNNNRNMDLLDGDGYLGPLNELFAMLDNIPINIVPLIPLMVDNSFGIFLEGIIPLYLAHYERNQIIMAIDESMREAARPKPEPPKKVKIINHIVSTDDTKNERECLICLNNFVEGEQTVMLKCGHFFHKDCLMPWFIEHHTCPTCRENIDEALLESSS